MNVWSKHFLTSKTSNNTQKKSEVKEKQKTRNMEKYKGIGLEKYQ